VHPDVQTFDLATQALLSEKSGGKNTSITVETVRQLAATTALRPMESRWRCILLDDAEMLQEVAQEALLKTLEDPPSFVVLILLANDAELLLPTIRSRCQAVDLRPVGRTTIADALVAGGIDAMRAAEIASLASGRPGWAVRAATNGTLIEQRRDAVERGLAWIGGSGYDRLVNAVRLGDSFTKRRPEVFADLDTLLGLWRDAMLLQVAQTHYLTYRGDAERLRELTRAWDLSDLHRAIHAVHTCVIDLEANVRPRLAMEAMVLQWPTLPEKR
jgi:DNA polymerase-3 subunit delta'